MPDRSTSSCSLLKMSAISTAFARSFCSSVKYTKSPIILPSFDDAALCCVIFPFRILLSATWSVSVHGHLPHVPVRFSSPGFSGGAFYPPPYRCRFSCAHSHLRIHFPNDGAVGLSSETHPAFLPPASVPVTKPHIGCPALLPVSEKFLLFPYPAVSLSL